MTRRDDSKAETRELILSAARRLFWEKGAGQCTMRNIAHEGGVSPASIIVHFKNKTALLEMALYEDIEKTLSQVLATLPIEGGLHAVLMYMVSAMFSLYDKNRELYRILIRDTFFEADHDNPTMALLLEENLQFVFAFIEQEKIKGTVRADADSYLASASFFYLYIGVLRDFLRNRELSMDTALARLSTMIDQQLVGILISGEEQ